MSTDVQVQLLLSALGIIMERLYPGRIKAAVLSEILLLLFFMRELQLDTVIRKFLITADDGKRYKANLQVDLIILLDKYGYPPVTIDDVYKEVLEQAENFKKYAK